MNRRLRAIERRVVDKDFRASAPPLDEAGLPDWDGEGLPEDAYERALGDLPDEDLTAAELEVRSRLAPYASVFEQLQRDKELGGEDVK